MGRLRVTATLLACLFFPGVAGAEDGFQSLDAPTLVRTVFAWHFENDQNASCNALAPHGVWFASELFDRLCPPVDRTWLGAWADPTADLLTGEREKARAYRVGRPRGEGDTLVIPVRVQFRRYARRVRVDVWYLGSGWQIKDIRYGRLGRTLRARVGLNTSAGGPGRGRNVGRAVVLRRARPYRPLSVFGVPSCQWFLE